MLPVTVKKRLKYFSKEIFLGQECKTIWVISQFIQISVSPIYYVVKQKEEWTQQGSCLGKDAPWAEGKGISNL